MAFVSIDIELMTHLVSKLEAAEQTMTECASAMRGDLGYVGLSCDVLPRFLVGGYSVGEVRQVRLLCRQRLDQAIAVRDAMSWLGWWGGNPVLASEVTFDETVLSGENAALAAGLVKDIISGRIRVEDGLPPELVDVLVAGAADPDFAVAFAGLVPPEELAQLLNLFDIHMGNVSLTPGPGLVEFKARYATLLDHFGSVYSLAAAAIPDGSAQQQGYVNQWHDVFAYHEPGSPVQALLSMVVARGRWPDVFLTGMKTGIEEAEGRMGAASWSLIYWDTAMNPRTIMDPGRSMQDGSPVQVADPMYGVWSAAAYNPHWFLDTYQGHDLVDIVFGRTGYYGSEFMDGSDFDHMIPTHTQVDSMLHSLFTERGFDQGSLNAFLMAASVANTWQSLTTDTPTVAVQVGHLFGALDYHQAEWDALPWWDKYRHEALAVFSVVTGIAAMFIPGPGWITGGLLVASFAAGAVDVGLYIAEGDYWSAAITGVFLIPIMIGGTIRLVQLTRAEWQSLRTGRVIEKAGEHLGVVEGKVTQITATEWETLTRGGVPTGRFPPSRPDLGDTAGGPGNWTLTKRSNTTRGHQNGGLYQEKITGVPWDDGAAMEYRVGYDSGQSYVDFDGYVWRGNPPEEVFLEAKHGYNELFFPGYGGSRDTNLKKFLTQAKNQIEAVRQTSPGARIEWHFSDKAVADLIADYFAKNDLAEIIVVFTP